MTREEAIQRLTDLQDGSGQTYEAIRMAIEALQFAEHFDLLKEHESLQEVVRCKDCIHWKADNEVFELGFCCVFPQKWVAETFYCADGERREE